MRTFQPSSWKISLVVLVMSFAVSSGPVSFAGPNPNGATSKLDLSRHTFNFVNNFKGKFEANLPIFGTVNLGTHRFGLCGGMSYGAHDTYWSESTSGRKARVPNQTIVPNKGTKLFQYLWNRQMDSLKRDGWFAVRRLANWMKKRVNDVKIAGRRVSKGLQTLSWEEFVDKVAPGIDKGWAIPLLLVNTQWGDKDAFSHNHQVLAIGYKLTTHGGVKEWDIMIYDPNCPGQESVLHTKSRKNSCGQYRYRGFFVTKYRGKTPYWAKTEAQTPGGIFPAPLKKKFGK